MPGFHSRILGQPSLSGPLAQNGLARLSQEAPRWIAWVNPPFLPYAPALAAAGVAVGKVLLIRTDGFGRPSARLPGIAGEALWTVEQALQSGACSAVLAWLDELTAGGEPVSLAVRNVH